MVSLDRITKAFFAVLSFQQNYQKRTQGLRNRQDITWPCRDTVHKVSVILTFLSKCCCF